MENGFECEIMNCLKYNFAMHTLFHVILLKKNVYLYRGTFRGRGNMATQEIIKLYVFTLHILYNCQKI